MSSPKQRSNTAPPQSPNDRLLVAGSVGGVLLLLAALVELCCRVIEKESIRSMDFSFMLSVKFSNAHPLVLQRIIVLVDWKYRVAPRKRGVDLLALRRFENTKSS
jgi:hypothetical protein